VSIDQTVSVFLNAIRATIVLLRINKAYKNEGKKPI